MAGVKLNVGNVEVIELLDTPMEFDFTMFFPNNQPQDFEAYQRLYPQSYGSGGRFRTYAQAYVLRSRGRNILVDTGIGPGPIEWLGGIRGKLVEEMTGKGVKPEDVDVVVFTHLHADHVGWNVRREGNAYKPTFAKAKYMVSQADWDHFTSPPMLEQSGVKQTVVPLQDLGVLELFSGETRLSEEVMTVPTPGHTPGHTSLLIASQGERAVVTGDLAHHPAQVDRTEWCAHFDTEPAKAIETRRQIFDRLEGEGLTAVICHFPPPGFGKLVRLEGQRVFQAL